MKRYKLLLYTLWTFLLAVPSVAGAQSAVNMVNGDSIILDACVLGSGTIYDDGGAMANYSSNFDGWVVIQADAGISIRLTGNYSTESCCDYIWVYDGNTALVSGVAGNGIIDVTATSGLMRMRFNTSSYTNYEGFALTWTTSGVGASCANPVTALDTTAITATAISLAWNASNTAGPFSIVCNGKVVGTANTNHYTISGLNPASYYDITVVATASLGNRCCASSLGVRTACGEPSLPYGEGFEGLVDGGFPPCWLSSVNFDGEEFLPQVVASQHLAGQRSLMLSCGNSESVGHFGMVTTPTLTSSGNHPLRLSLMASHSGTVVVVGVCDSVGSDHNAYGFTPLQTITLWEASVWQEFVITWNATSGHRLAFRMEQSQQNGVGRRVYIDNISMENCGVNSVQVSHIDYDRFTVSWSTYGAPTCSLGIRPEGTMVDSITINNAVSPVNITGLGANRRYQVTVYPTCGTEGISRSTVARTSLPPTSAAIFCSDFYAHTNMPQNWTFHTNNSSSYFSFGNNTFYFDGYNTARRNIYSYSDDNYNFGFIQGNYLVSERLTGLAGKQIAVNYYSGRNSEAIITIGTMVYPDDTTSFVPLATDTMEGGLHTLVATVPATSTGRHIAVRTSSVWSGYYYILGVQGGVALVDSVCLVHRRGTSVEFSWAQAYDTVLIQYGPRDFTIGTGTIDTFYNVSRGTVTGLAPSTNYDFYIYRPATLPCVDFRQSVRTAQHDYPLPYCEGFNGLNDNAWGYNYGDWKRLYSTNSYPKFGPQGYDGNAGNTLQMASWGFDWGYYSTALLPDVEVDSHSILSFYINDNAPDSKLIVGTVPEGYEDEYFLVLDTIPISAYHKRVHINYVLRPSDTLFNCRLALRYIHPYEYSFYSCYIDELQIAHGTYDAYQCSATDYTTATLSLGQLTGTDSVRLTIIGGGTSFDTVVDSSQVANINLTNLDTGTFYLCYVQPLGGCISYAGGFVTRASISGSGSGNGNCFPFDDVLSYELPYRWAGSGSMTVTVDDYLWMAPSAAVATHPLYGNGSTSFAFRVRGADMNDTLLLGMIPADSIHIDSTHYNYNAALYTPIDTFVLDTAWRYYMLRLPDTDTNRVRLVFRALGDTVGIDTVSFSNCPIVHFTVDGNTILCELDPDQTTTYYLHISDSTGEDDRVILVDQNPYRVEGLHLNRRYNIWWQCLYGENSCRPTVSIHTGGLIPLPYCEDFNTVEGTLNIPPTWEFFKANANDELRLDMGGPSLYMSPYYSYRWEYAVLPAFNADSALSLHAYLYSGDAEIGYLANGADTGSFVPLWTSTTWGSWRPELDLSQYADKRIAIRTRGSLQLYYIHVYGTPLAKVSLVAARTFKVTTSVDKPYWLHYRDYYNSYQDTLFYVDTTVFYIHDTNITSSSYVYLEQTDSTGYTCENSQRYNLSSRWSLPYCHNAGNGDYFHFTYGNGTNYITRDNDNLRAIHFYGDRSSWKVMPDLVVDSIKHVGMRVRFDAASAYDTMVVGVMTDAYDTLTFTPVDTLFYTREDDSIQTAFVDFSNYTGDGRWITFHHLPSQQGVGFDIRYVYAESCPGALGATASLYRWNQVLVDGLKTPFYMEYFRADESSQGNSSNTILRVDTVPLILSLESEAPYEFYFRCDSASYTCVPPQHVTTLGAPLDVPSCTDFDTVAAGSMLRNWTILHPDIAVTNTIAHSTPNSISMPIGVTSYLVSPDVNIDSIQKVAVSVWFQVEDLSDRLVIGVMKDPHDLNTFYPVRSLAPIEAGVWQKAFVDLKNAPEGAHFIAIRARSNRLAGGRHIYVDDISVSTCAAFDLRVQSLQSGSIDLAWNQIGTPDITVTVEDNGVLTNTYTHVTPPLHIEPLSLQHYYTFRIASVCDNNTVYCSNNYVDSVSVISPAPSTGCVNSTDLNSSQSVYFSGTYGNPYAQAGAINYGSMHPDSRHTVCYDTAQRDPRTGNQLRTIPEGYTSSVRLGNWSTNAYNPEAEGVIYSLYVDTNNFELLLLRYAAVLQDPLHAASDQPRFRMELLDTNYNIIDSACTSADFIADQNLGWNTADDGVLWKDWTAVGVDLSAHAGEQVYFRLTTYDCNEGSHYGYAYFTLECMRKNMNTESCGDVVTNTLSAPEGFHYRWYTSQSTATVSTAQSITVPSEDITYYCEVSKLDNAACNFTISAYGGTRYPMASFDTSIVIDSCRFYVTFTNTSGISRDGVNRLPGETCESSYWDFGNGTTSTSLHGSAVYFLPGSYTVRLISGLANDECQDTMVMVLTLSIPEDMPPADTANISICDNEYYTFFGQNYNTPGTFYHNVPLTDNTCDSIYVLQLEVRATSSSDSVAMACDSLNWRGQTYTTDGTYPSGPIGLNVAGCDTSVNLILSVFPTYDTVDTLIFCPYRPYLYRGVDYGGPVVFDTTLYTVDNCDSVVHVNLRPRDSSYHLVPRYNFDSTDWIVPDSMIAGCAPTKVYLIDSTEGAVQWDWTLFLPDTMLTFTTQEIEYAFPEGSDSLAALLSLVVTSNEGCLDTVGWPLFVFPSPVPDFQWEPLLPSISSPRVQFENLSNPLAEQMEANHSMAYLWRVQVVEGGSFDTSSDANPVYRWGEEGDNMAGDYVVRLINEWTHQADSFRVADFAWADSTLFPACLYPVLHHTCVDSAEHVVTITNEYLQFPNLVTPNGDGTNDRWEVVNLLEFGNYSMNELWVYDRTGALVYHVKNIRRSDQFWDPEATRSPDGTYYYRFVAEGPYGVVKRNGTIEVLRK